MAFARRRVGWFLAGICVLALVWLTLPRRAQPRALYAGKDALSWSLLLAGTPAERTNALIALKSMGPAAAHDLATALPAKINLKDRTLGAVGKMLPGPLAWRLLKPTGYFDRPPEHSVAAKGLEALGPDARSVASEMEAAIPLTAPDVYVPLISALMQINPEGIMALGRVLRAGEVSRTSQVASQLRMNGSNALFLLPDLLWVATNQQPGAALAPMAIGAAGEKALPAIRALLADKDKNIVAVGINSLAAMGSAGDPCLPDLIALAEKGNLELRAMAIMAIGSVNPTQPRSLALLKDCAREPERTIRMAAISAFQNATVRVWRDRPLFDALVNDPDPEVRKRARAVLGDKNPLDRH